jgi:hypothetical protein
MVVSTKNNGARANRGNKQQQWTARNSRPAAWPRRRWWIIGVSFLLLLSMYGSIYQWNQSYVDLSLEAPLDHLQSALWTPLFHLSGCPDMNATIRTGTAAAAVTTTTTATATTTSSTMTSNNNNISNGSSNISSNGSSSNSNSSSSNNISNTIPMIMISARPYELVAPVWRTWTDAHFKMIVVNTTAMSRNYVNTRCPKETFKSRLFGIYQQVLAPYVADGGPYNNHYNEYLVTVEDDARLLDNGDTLRHELQLAVERHYQYYSFSRNSSPTTNASTSTSTTCWYRFGTQAQLWSRRMIQKILTVDDDTYCRLPIDMYIAQQGPWYVTQRPLVQHVGQRLMNIP